MKYANNGLIVAVVMLCLVVPVGAGFLMPNNESIDSWQTEITPLDLTPNYKVTDVPNTSQYSGVNDNLFGFTDDVGYYVEPNETTNVSTIFSNNTLLSTYQDTAHNGTYTTTASAMWHTLVDYAPDEWFGYKTSLIQYYAVDDGLGTNSVIYTFDGETYDILLVFKNGRGQLYNSTNHNMAIITNEQFSYTKTGTATATYYGKSPTSDMYIDPSKGFHFNVSSHGPVVWGNGYTNHSIRMIFHVTNGSLLTLQFDEQNLKVGIGLVGNSIRVGYQQGLSPSVGDMLGSKEVYDYVMLYIDSDANIIQFTGLMGMQSFTDSYVDKIGNSINFDTPVEPFHSMTFEQGSIDYYVSSTTIESGTIKAIKDVTVYPGNFKSSSQWQLVLANPTVFGDTLAFQDTSFDVVRGYVTLSLYNEETQTYEDKRVAVRDMKITRIVESSTPHILINGERLNPNVEVDVNNISLGGVWLTSVYLYEVEWTHKTNYFWEEGGFNLDLTGYCVVGMIVSALCFIAAAMMRSPGWADEIAMGLAVVFGVIYFAVMITG